MSEGLDLSDGCVTDGILPLFVQNGKERKWRGDRYSGPKHSKKLLRSM